MDDSRKLDRTWLCSVVFSDIVNYSSQSDNVQIKWKHFFNDVLTDALKAVPADDRVVLDTGDGAAICFLGDPEAAMTSTLSMRTAFAAGVAEDPGGPKVRLGINLGPVKLVKDINGNINALGDGINVAQRIMSFAGPNQVLVSRSFFEVISRLSDDYNRLFRHAGVRQDKHVREHTVYELAPNVSEMGPAPVAMAADLSEDRSAESGHKRSLQGLLFAGAAGLLVLALVSFFVFRTKPAPVVTPPVSQVQQPLPSNTPVPAPTAATTPAPRIEKPPVVPTNTGRAVAAAPPPAPVTTTATAPSPAVSTLGGRWQGEVKYSWGPVVAETFDFNVDGNVVMGTASYLHTRRGILDGKIEGNTLTFTTKSQSVLGEKTYEEKHQYRGHISGDTIEFMLQTDSGYDQRPPETFTAKRASGDVR